MNTKVVVSSLKFENLRYAMSVFKKIIIRHKLKTNVRARPYFISRGKKVKAKRFKRFIMTRRSQRRNL